MHVKVVTLEYDERLRGFPQEVLDRACAGGHLLEVREHFFVHAGHPHLAFVLVVDDAAARPQGGAEADPGRALAAALQPLYRSLRHWRNERAKAAGVPAYVLFRNAQLVEVCRRLPETLAALREIDGIGEATCAKYGAEVLALIPAELRGGAPAQEGS